MALPDCSPTWAFEQLFAGTEHDARLLTAVTPDGASFHVTREADLFLVVRHDSSGGPDKSVRFERTGASITISGEGFTPFSVTVQPNPHGECRFFINNIGTPWRDVDIRNRALNRLFFNPPA